MWVWGPAHYLLQPRSTPAATKPTTPSTTQDSSPSSPLQVNSTVPSKCLGNNFPNVSPPGFLLMHVPVMVLVRTGWSLQHVIVKDIQVKFRGRRWLVSTRSQPSPNPQKHSVSLSSDTCHLQSWAALVWSLKFFCSCIWLKSTSKTPLASLCSLLSSGHSSDWCLL